MRLLFIRHGDPDYENDCLTFDGEQEARMLAEYLPELNPGKIYVSTFGRARQTAEYYLKKTGEQAMYCDWLQEMGRALDVNDHPELIAAYNDHEFNEDGSYKLRIPWDILGKEAVKYPELMDRNRWRDTVFAKNGRTLEMYDERCRELDKLLAENGYVREGGIYRCEQGNHNTLTFITHLGCTNALLSHLFNVSPFVTWNTLCMHTSSITEVVSEEREKGYASFRALRIGDISHLSLHHREPTCSARFVEVYEDEGRH